MPLRVLIVDDNKDAADTLVHLLATWGYQAQAAYDGLTALESVQRERPNVALIDLGLPGLDGYQLALHLRRNPDLERVPLVAMTGFPSTSQARSREYGFNEHLMKPIEPNALHALLRTFENEQLTSGSHHGVRISTTPTDKS